MFYELDTCEKSAELWFDDNYKQVKNEVCPSVEEHQWGVRDNNINLKLIFKKGKVTDIMAAYSYILISEKVAKLFEENDVTGYALKPVIFTNKELPCKYYELYIIGKGGQAHSDSKIEIKQKCNTCNFIRYTKIQEGIGIIVDKNNWDGSDIFTINGYELFVLITEKVKNLIQNNNITGYKIIKSTEVYTVGVK